MALHTYKATIEYTVQRTVDVTVDDADPVWCRAPSEDSLRDEAVARALRDAPSGAWLCTIEEVL